MLITFPQVPPYYRAADLAVVFLATVDNRALECAISVEALEDHFGAASARQDDVLQAFSTHRADIEAIARELLHADSHTAPLIRSGLLRFKRAQDRS